MDIKKNNRSCDAARGCRLPLHLLQAQSQAGSTAGRLLQLVLLVQEVTLGRGQTLTGKHEDTIALIYLDIYISSV